MDKTETWWLEGMVVIEQAWPLVRSAGCRAAPHRGFSLISSPYDQKHQMVDTSENLGLSLTRVLSESGCKLLTYNEIYRASQVAQE